MFLLKNNPSINKIYTGVDCNYVNDSSFLLQIWPPSLDSAKFNLLLLVYDTHEHNMKDTWHSIMLVSLVSSSGFCSGPVQVCLSLWFLFCLTSLRRGLCCWAAWTWSLSLKLEREKPWPTCCLDSSIWTDSLCESRVFFKVFLNIGRENRLVSAVTVYTCHYFLNRAAPLSKKKVAWEPATPTMHCC